MPELLVSVRNVSEARIAAANGAAIIDIKEPSAGSLGAAAPTVWRQVVQQIASPMRVSIALGELADTALESRIACLPAVGFAKVGLANCAHDSKWPQRWQAVLQELPDTTEPVAVVYADWLQTQAPPPDEVVSHAAQWGCSTLLVDTGNKHGGWLLEHLPYRSLAKLIASARQQRMRIALAGSIRPEHLPILAPLHADIIAVRGAVCSGSRTSSIDAARVRAMADMLCG